MPLKRQAQKEILLSFIFIIAIPVLALGQSIVPDDLKRTIVNEYSGLKALDYIQTLCTFDRSGASQGLFDAQSWVFNKLKAWGIEDVALDPFPADGEKIYLDNYPAGYAWEKKRAVLSLVEPYLKKIIDYAEVPTALIQYSNSAHVTAELVDVGAGIQDGDYAGKKVEGKIILTSSISSSVYQAAIKERGALGIISYWENDEPDRSRFPDQVSWMSIPQELNTSHFGFAISRAIADELKDLCSKGKVLVRADVEAEIKKGNYYVLSSAIPGAGFPEKEVILTAHINHYRPGANDNASGCALIMEAERAIKFLIDARRIQPPQRTIRFVWIQEHAGTKAYLDSRPDLGERAIFAVNLDMVGENVLLCESLLRLVLGPHSCPSFLDDLMNDLLQDVAQSGLIENRGTKIPFSFALEKFNGAISDHYYYPAGRISIPTTFLYLWPDNFYHSQQDTPDKCDPTMLKRLGFVTMAVALYAASGGEREALELSELVYAEGSKRIFQAVKEGLDDMRNLNRKGLYLAYKEAANKLEKTSEKEERAIRSVFKLSGTQRVTENVEKLAFALRKTSKQQRIVLDDFYGRLAVRLGQKPEKIKLTGEEIKSSRIIPQRLFRGPLNLNFVKKKMGASKSKWFDEAENRIQDFFLIRDEIANFVNDVNSVLDIRNAVSAEFHPLSLEDVFAFLDGVREAGFLSLVERQP